MASTPSNIPDNSALAGFMQNVPNRFGLQQADEQRTIDAVVTEILVELGVDASVTSVRWGRMCIEVADGAAAMRLRFALPRIEEALRAVNETVVIVTRTAR